MTEIPLERLEPPERPLELLKGPLEPPEGRLKDHYNILKDK